MGRAEDVLKELSQVGAVGGSRKALVAIGSPIVEIAVDRGLSTTCFPDEREADFIQALDDALGCASTMMAAMRGLREALERARNAWLPQVESAEETESADGVQDALSLNRKTLTGLVLVPSPSPVIAPSSDSPEKPEYAQARQAVLRKIRGEDLGAVSNEDEDDIPFVGQVRALSDGQEVQEVSLGVVGTVKPSFLGGQDDA